MNREKYPDAGEEFQMFARSQLVEEDVVLWADARHPANLVPLIGIALHS